MSDGTERVHSSGGLTPGDRLIRIEMAMERHADRVEKWQHDHQNKDNEFQEEIMASINQRKGNAQVGNLIVIVISALAAICSIAGMFINRH